MAYCIKCGNPIKDDDCYCNQCGYKIDHAKSIWDNDSIDLKCPNCGESIPAFIVRCPFCGYEFRNIKASESSVSRFVYSLNNQGGSIEAINRKAYSIRSYSISHSKEDILELFSSATRDINTFLPKAYTLAGAKMKSSEYRAQLSVASAWIDKLVESYQIARNAFPNDPVLPQLKKILKQVRRDVKQTKRIIIFGNLVRFFGVIFAIAFGTIAIILVFYCLFKIAMTLVK